MHYQSLLCHFIFDYYNTQLLFFPCSLQSNSFICQLEYSYRQKTKVQGQWTLLCLQSEFSFNFFFIIEQMLYAKTFQNVKSNRKCSIRLVNIIYALKRGKMYIICKIQFRICTFIPKIIKTCIMHGFIPKKAKTCKYARKKYAYLKSVSHETNTYKE